MTAQHDENNIWKPLRVLLAYRLFLACIYLLLFYNTDTRYEFSQFNHSVFAITSHLYFLLICISSITLHYRVPRFTLQVHGLTLVDILSMIFLMHANGGIYSGLGILLVITCASIGLLSNRKMALFHPAVATLGLFFETFYTGLASNTSVNYTNVATLGFTLLATGFLTQTLSQRAKKSAALAQQRGDDLASLEQLNGYVIQHMRSGILALNERRRIEMINVSACQLLNAENAQAGLPLESVCAELDSFIQDWQNDPNHPKQMHFPWHGTSLQLQISSIELGAYRLVILLEDNAEISQRLQQMKLASLGRLTASIAHEIRNPLGAISHANQLLQESSHLDKVDRRMVEIVQSNANRVNTIIENVLQISRRSKTRPQSIQLKPWLQDFLQEYRQIKALSDNQIQSQVEPDNLTVQFDPSQLHQVLTSLLNNALYYGRDSAGEIAISITGKSDDRPYLEVRDQGPGIATDNIAQLFEPFFTTENAGTGLGLYIAKELSECNYARLDYKTTPIGACFRLTFTPGQGH